MTYEEAIEEMENIYQNGFDNDFDNDEIEKPLDAIRIAIEALEKQISKKPTCIKKHGRLKSGFCPYCKEAVMNSFYHCPKCSQKLDWSEE